MLRLPIAALITLLVSAPTATLAQAAPGQGDGLAQVVTGACLQALSDRPHGLERVETGASGRSACAAWSAWAISS
jgi:hypothetical protein